MRLVRFFNFFIFGIIYIHLTACQSTGCLTDPPNRSKQSTKQCTKKTTKKSTKTRCCVKKCIIKGATCCVAQKSTRTSVCTTKDPVRPGPCDAKQAIMCAPDIPCSPEALSLAANKPQAMPNYFQDRLYQLKNLERSNHHQPQISTVRLASLREAAMIIGAQTGLAARAQQMNEILIEHECYLNRIFNFYRLLLEDNVLPPILLEARETLNQPGPDTLQLADQQYLIFEQARFVTAPPHWRDYLWMRYEFPPPPHDTLLPRNKTERYVWSIYLEEGFAAGINQAESIFKENLGRIKRDFEGMIRYRKLLAQGLVSPPFVAKMNLGVTGNSEKLAINDRVLKITAYPALQVHTQNWEPSVIEHACR